MLTKQTLLYVDDDARHAKSLVKDLKERGVYSIHTATTVQEALALAGKHAIDIALIDIQIPRSDPSETSVNSRQQRHGIALGETLTDLYPDIALLFYSNFDDCRSAIEKLSEKRRKHLLESRARRSSILPGMGYILKGADVHTIDRALQAVSLGHEYFDPRIPDHQFRSISQKFLDTMGDELATIVTEGYFSVPDLTREQQRFLEQLGRKADILSAGKALHLTENGARNRADDLYRKLFGDLNLPATMHKAHLAARVWTLYALEEGIRDQFDDPHS